MPRIYLFTRAAALAAACTVASAGLHAQTTQTKPSGAQSTAPANQQLSSDDMEFAKQAAMDGMKEVEHAKLVASKATNAQVKAYANRLVKDHTNANNQLKAIAKRKNIELPAAPSSTANAASSACVSPQIFTLITLVLPPRPAARPLPCRDRRPS